MNDVKKFPTNTKQAHGANNGVEQIKKDVFEAVLDAFANVETYISNMEHDLKSNVVIDCIKTYSTKEVAQIIGSSTEKVTELIRNGKLKAFKPGKVYMVREEVLKEFILEQEDMQG